ncbi:MAG: serine hydrolase [Ignavibacteriaceae bacterium]|nr:serine hydrolase [Ignavibacteriaceae bacterium]
MRLIIFIFLFTVSALSQQLYFPPLTGNQWETMPFISAGWDSTKTDSLFTFLEEKNTKAFLVLKDGKIVIEKYFGAFVRDSLWYWASAGKTLTSFLVGLAQQKGHLSIQDTTSKYLGRWTSAPLEKERLITVRNQLTMTSGLNDAVPDHYCTLPECLLYKADAGTRWAYHNGPYTLLDSVMQKAAGQTLNQFFISELRAKTGMTGFFLKSGYNNVFYSTARSMARFGLLILNRGRWDTTAVMSDTAYFREMTNTSQDLNKSYGYLWWLNGKESYMLPQSQFVFPGSMNPYAPDDMISALGKNGQFLSIVPGRNIIMVRMGNAPDSSLVPFLLNNDIWKLLTPVISPVSRAEGNYKVSPFKLEQNYPNPFIVSTNIKYTIPAPSHFIKGEGGAALSPSKWERLGDPGDGLSGSAQVSGTIGTSGDVLVTLKLYDILGREIATLVNEYQYPGAYEVKLNAEELDLSSGIYFYEIKIGGYSAVKKMLVFR